MGFTEYCCLPSDFSFKFQSSMTIFHHKLPTRGGRILANGRNWMQKWNPYMFCQSLRLLQTLILLFTCDSCWYYRHHGRLTRIKFGMLYVKTRVQLFGAWNIDYALKLRCDHMASYISQGVVEGVKKRGKISKLAKTLTTKTWSLGRVYRMCNEIGNRWFECWQPIGLLDQPSNMEIGLCWYENKNGSMSTYDLTDHIMVELETIIALTTMTYIAKINK